MKEDTRDFLIKHREEKYKKFSEALIPLENRMLGVRLPILRKKAMEIARGNWKEELCSEDLHFEEIMLRGMVISYAKGSMDELLPYIEGFIPKVDNWSLCDSVFMKMDVLRKDRERTWEFIQPFLYSDKEFEVRVAIIIMMQHLLKCDEQGKTIKRLRSVSMERCMTEEKEKGKYLEVVLDALNREFLQYYASMAAAWTIAEAFCCYPASVLVFLKENKLDDRTYNRALQKITESLIPQPDVKDMIRAMKRTKVKRRVNYEKIYIGN